MVHHPRLIILVASVMMLALPACRDDVRDAPAEDTLSTPTDTSADGDITAPVDTTIMDSRTSDIGAADADVPDDVAETDADAAIDADDGDATGSSCTQAVVNRSWQLERADDVSIGYINTIDPVVESHGELIALFERYNPGPDVGTFSLGEGADENFGTCAHCLYLRGTDNARAYFADAGVLVTREDPYSRRMDATVMGLRLIEVTVDPTTRASTPVADGGCVEVADFEITGNFPAEGWTCPGDQFGDGVSCECECGAPDPDCYTGGGCPPFDPDCPGAGDPLPVSDCAAAEICAFDPTIESTACAEVCDWEGRVGCIEGVCTFSAGVEPEDVCMLSEQRLERLADIGEPCTMNGYQRFCAISGDFADGYCGPNDVCRAVCTADAECAADPTHTCRPFNGIDGLGYCGPEPSDG